MRKKILCKILRPTQQKTIKRIYVINYKINVYEKVFSGFSKHDFQPSNSGTDKIY